MNIILIEFKYLVGIARFYIVVCTIVQNRVNANLYGEGKDNQNFELLLISSLFSVLILLCIKIYDV